MRRILFAISLLFALCVPVGAQPSLCTVTGTILKPSGDPCASCRVQIVRSRRGGVVLSNTIVDVLTDAEGDISFTAVQGSLTTIRGEFRIGAYDFRGGLDLFIPNTSTADLEDLQSGEDALSGLVGGGGDVASVFGRTGVVVAATNDYTWAQINKATSSIADITTRSASDLSSGTLPDARFPATLPAASGVNLTALNASNLGSGTIPDGRFPATLPAASGVNLTALNATQLTSGTVPLARISALTNTEISASAAIALSKLATLTASRAVVLDGSGVLSASAVTSTELGYVGGVTGAIQTQLDGKQATGNYITALTGDVTASGPGSSAATINNLALSKLAALTADRAVVSNGSGVLSVSSVTATELGYLSGVTSALQTQIDGKSATGHAHAATDITSATLALARGGTGASLADPEADRILFWDESANAFTFLEVGSGLSLSGTTLTATGAVGGSDTQVQFNDGGSLGGDAGLTFEKTGNVLTVSGGVAVSSLTSGRVSIVGTSGVIEDDPGLLFNKTTDVLTLTRASIGATSSDGFVLENTTAAAAGAQQYSPRVRLGARGWKTTATAESRAVEWAIENRPVQGTANPDSTLAFALSVNGGAYTDRMILSQSASVVTSLSLNGTSYSGIGLQRNGTGKFYIQTDAFEAGTYISASGANFMYVEETEGKVSIGQALGSPFSANATAQLNILNGLSSRVGFRVRGAASQSANLLNLTDSASTVLSSFDSAGRALMPLGSTSNVGYGFLGDPNTGLYSAGADAFSAVAGGTVIVTFNSSGAQLLSKTFSNLGTPSDGTLVYCSDCTAAATCADSGTGALAKRIAGAWVCN